MVCSDCSQNTTTITVSNCQPCDAECVETINTGCIAYSGPDLPNLGIVTNQGINDIFAALEDTAISTMISTRVTIPSADVLQLFSTPYILVPTPGANKFIQIISINLRMSGTLSTAYTSTNSLVVKSTNATGNSFTASDAILQQTDTNVISQMIPQDTHDTVRVNEAIKLYADTGDPTLGTGDLEVYIIYLVNDVA